jgi:hypothetical protein
MQKEVFAVRLDKQTRAALEAAALGSDTKPRTLAQRLIGDGLKRSGYLPKARPTARA